MTRSNAHAAWDTSAADTVRYLLGDIVWHMQEYSRHARAAELNAYAIYVFPAHSIHGTMAGFHDEEANAELRKADYWQDELERRTGRRL